MGLRTGDGSTVAPARILVVSTDAPGPLDRGFRIRVHHLAAALARAGHEVTFLGARPAAREDRDPLERLGVEVQGFDVPELDGEATGAGLLRRTSHLWNGSPSTTLALRVRAAAEAVEPLLATRRFHVVQVEVPELVECARSGGSLVVLDAHNIWSELTLRRQVLDRCILRRAVRAVAHRRQHAVEVRAWRSVDLCLATSERERAIMAAAGGGPTALVPNGVDTDQVRPGPWTRCDTESRSPCLVFVGLMAYGPNADAVSYLVRDILPLVHERRPDVRVQIVGLGAPASLRRLAGPSVDFTGRVQDVRPHIRAAAVCVVPLRVGSGTRLKVLEALAMGRPVVTTSIGVEGLDVIDGTHVLVADGADAFAAAVLRVLEHPSLASALARAGRALSEESYAWSRVGARLVEVYDEMLAGRS